MQKKKAVRRQMFTIVYNKLLSNFFEPRDFRLLKLLIAAGYLAANRFNFFYRTALGQIIEKVPAVPAKKKIVDGKIRGN